MNFRIYRLPGSRRFWHIDTGPGTQVWNVHGYDCFTDSRSVDIGGENVPRAWIEISGAELHVVNGVAIFRFPAPVQSDTIDGQRETTAFGERI
jgi:hypothetical protein